ncbi:MFS transporter [Vibrio salinus]|uniref:MFS transporter n=1 Tax=Vibrio salinus TaxID=2899784 RepID=UPI001E485C11|nr:MFS transporter [Vibrio salinus]MCE0496104.1 MFS transporter [Vibrio salinus]
MSHIEQSDTALSSENIFFSESESIKPWPAFWAVSIGFFMIMLDTTIIAVAQPNIQIALQTSLNSVIWVNSSYLLAYSVPMLLSGRLGDRFSPRNIYILGIIIFTFSSILCGLSNTISLLIVARVFQGIGAALMGPQTLSVINRVFPVGARGPALATWGAVSGLATFSGPLLGGVIVAFLGWQWIFFVNVPLGIIAIPLTLRYIPKFSPNSHRFDIPGVLLSGIGLFGLVFSIQQGQELHWNIAIWTILSISIISLFCFIQSQKSRENEALVPLSLFRTQDFSISVLSLFMISIAVNAQIVPVMYFLQRIDGCSPLTTAMLTVSMPACGVILASKVGRIIGKVTAPYVVFPAFIVTAFGALFLMLAMMPERPVWLITIGYGIFGIGAAFIWSPLAAYATRNVPETLQGAASGVFNTFRILGAVLGNSLIAFVIEDRLRNINIINSIDNSPLVISPADGLRLHYAISLIDSVWLPIVTLLAGAFISLFLSKKVVQRKV